MSWNMKDGHHIDDCNGNEWWYKDEHYHREDGPAFIGEGGTYQTWWVNGKRHRIDGPAIIYKDRKRWFVNGVEVHCETQEQLERLLRLKAFW